MLPNKQKVILREMIKRNPDPIYMEAMANDDNYALSEIANFTATRMKEISEDQKALAIATSLYS